MKSLHQVRISWVLILMFACVMATPVIAEECRVGSEIDTATRTAIENAAQRYYQAAAAGNTADLQQNSIPAVSSDFAGIQAAINENKDNFGTGSSIRGIYQLDAQGNAPLKRAEFYCGIMNSPNYVGFAIPNLPPGNYALAMLDAQGGKNPITVSFVLQQVGAQWKIGGVYIRPTAINGHDSKWYIAQAQQYKAKGQNLNAWFYYLTAWDLAAPVRFMGTKALDRIADEMQSVRPQNPISPQSPVDLSFNGKSYKVTDLFPVPLTDGLGLVVKFQVPDVSNTAAAYADNVSVMKALLNQYPELREAFVSIVARAVAPSGNDYGTLLSMKDIK
ncbi:MAG TPA: hypothetical protein VN577_22600 [Terriglobales bacterium]|nr:hypothetical protein [Terriglobales bacterium]